MTPTALVVPTHISSYSKYCNIRAARSIMGAGVATPASFAWVANQAAFIPLFLPWPYLVKRMFWVNGSVAAGNSDIAILTPTGVRLFGAGSTANSGASGMQYVTLGTELLLLPGKYFLGYTNDGTTNRVTGSSGAGANARFVGYLQQAAALPIPATATFASWGTTPPGLPLIGITNTPSNF